MKPLIPVDVAEDLRKRRWTWRKISEWMKRIGYPPDPFPAFLPESLAAAVYRKRKKK